jgi:hypothetical protein
MIATILTIGIPTLAVLVGILLNRNDANRLDGRITGEVNSLRVSLQAEIAASRKQSHDDIMMLVGIAREHETRLTRVESRF